MGDEITKKKKKKVGEEKQKKVTFRSVMDLKAKVMNKIMCFGQLVIGMYFNLPCVLLYFSFFQLSNRCTGIRARPDQSSMTCSF